METDSRADLYRAGISTSLALRRRPCLARALGIGSPRSGLNYIRHMVPWRNSVPRKRAALAPASFINPCLPTRAERAPVADGWMHEIKHDGFRLQIHARDKRVRLYTMTGVDWTERYPWIVEDVARLNVSHAIIDAECCCDGKNGVTNFERLMARVNDAQRLRLCVRLVGDRRRRHAQAAPARAESRARQAAAQGQAWHPLQRTPAR